MAKNRPQHPPFGVVFEEKGTKEIIGFNHTCAEVVEKGTLSS